MDVLQMQVEDIAAFCTSGYLSQAKAPHTAKPQPMKGAR